MPSRDFSPKKFFQKVIKQWWIIFLAMIISGAAGAGLSFLKAPRYEAEAMISTSVDYTLLPELEDYEEDRMINEAGWVMLSDMVLESVQAQAHARGIQVSFTEITDTFSAERIDDLWTLRVVGEDPASAADLANLWVDEAFAQLESALAHALTADGHARYIAALESCASDTEDAAAGICVLGDNDAIKDVIDAQTTFLEQELALGRGINPAARFTVTSYAQVPTSPTYQARGVMAFLGLLLGLVTGLIMVWFMGKRA